ncbi:MAG: fibrinogen-like YCDxxxxGGGW domain-containing protein, partial [Candidatus Gracilibacteria bacterium]|nr:fibrinogen-like YCDxxxxGGGW domain-containing protein [Candidatus Gracilibacteria bacterium]
VSGDFGINASGATIDVCGSDVTADQNGLFSTTRNYGDVCNNITAIRTGYTCSTTTNGPASLTSNVTNIAGSCSVNTQVASCSGKIANSSYNTATSITQTLSGASWLPTNIAVYNTTASTTECRYTCSSGYHTEDNGVSCISDTKSCTITNGTGIQTWSGSVWGECLTVSCNSGYTATINSCEKSSLMTNIIGYWDFDDGTGQITKDKLGNGNDLYVYNDSADIGSWVTGKIGGGAYKLDGSGWIRTDGLNFASGVRTVSFWFKVADTIDTAGTFISYENSSDPLKEDNLGQDNQQCGNSVYTTLYEKQYKYGMNVKDTNWHFFSISKGTNTIICMDGICEYTGINSTSGLVTPDTIDLNGGLGYGYSEFTGGLIMDELRMFSTSYTKTQLEQMYTDSDGSTVTIVDSNGAKMYSNGTYATSCNAYRNSIAYNSNGNGTYRIKPDNNVAYKVYCDMTTQGGGRTLILKYDKNYATDTTYGITKNGLRNVKDRTNLEVYNIGSTVMDSYTNAMPLIDNGATMFMHVSLEVGDTLYQEVFFSDIYRTVQANSSLLFDPSLDTNSSTHTGTITTVYNYTSSMGATDKTRWYDSNMNIMPDYDQKASTACQSYYNDLSQSWSSAMWSNTDREGAVYCSCAGISLTGHNVPHVNWGFVGDDNTQQIYGTDNGYPLKVGTYCATKSNADSTGSCGVLHRLNLMFIR